MNSILYIADTYAAPGFRQASFDEILDGARKAINSRVRKGTDLTSPRLVRDFLTLRLAHQEHELFTVLFLDSRHRLIAVSDLFRGTVDRATVYPREVVKEALRHNSAAILLAHNHPSGIAEPSYADEQITRQIRDALALVDINVLDHFIVADGATVSFAERGLL